MTTRTCCGNMKSSRSYRTKNNNIVRSYRTKRNRIVRSNRTKHNNIVRSNRTKRTKTKKQHQNNNNQVSNSSCGETSGTFPPRTPPYNSPLITAFLAQSNRRYIRMPPTGLRYRGRHVNFAFFGARGNLGFGSSGALTPIIRRP